MAIREDIKNDRSSEYVDPIARNGLIMAIGIILGFALGFLTNWSLGEQEDWSLADLPTLMGLFVGIVLMLISLYRILPYWLEVREYERARKYFIAGVALAFAGVFTSVLVGLPWLRR